MAEYKVSYFPGKGNGEIMRLVLVIAEQKFEDERLTLDEWMKVKSGEYCCNQFNLLIENIFYF